MKLFTFVLLKISSMKITSKFLIIPTVAMLSLEAMAGQEHKLWYDSPAQVWTEALPLGNGRLGAMVYGNPGAEQIQLNEETIWAGRPNNNANPEAREWISKIRQLVFDGKYREAQDMATAHVKSKTNQGMPYQSFGDLRLNFPGHIRYENYQRELSLDSARVVVRYEVDGVNYTRETFSSFTDQVVITRITADKPGKVTFNATLTSPHPDVMIASEGNDITLDGISSNHEGLKGKVEFQGRVTAVAKGGIVTSRDGVLSVENADEAVVYTSIATNFNNYTDITGDEVARSKKYLAEALKKPFADAKKDHVEFYQKEIGASSLDLGEDKFADVPTDVRIERFKETNDAHLVANYYKFGRYLLVSSSQPGGQAANLQGIWNDKLFPSWDSKYTCNINLEMNYWPSEVTNLTHLNEPLFSLIKEVSKTGAETAKIMYGAPGWVLHHNTDIWRVTGSIDNAPSGMWMGGGAWLSSHLWQHYLYSGDVEFLREAYPIMKGAAEFYDATMVYEPFTGELVVCPSNSPENGPKGHNATTVAGATMDNQLVTELWNSVIAAAAILDTDKEFSDRLKERVAQISPMRIGSWGQLQEWMGDWDNPDDTHRHVSHLYGMYPSNQISPFRTPELFDAARTSLIHRGDPSTGWSMGWKVCLWARMLDGDHAYKLITDQLTLVRNEKKKGGTYPNFFDAHPPFQIDGNFGCVAGIAEMLMQSHDGFIYILPALPSVWREGKITGLRARGGFEIDLSWKDGKIETLTVKSTIGGNCRLRSLTPLKGSGLKTAKGENPNALFAVDKGLAPIINPEAKLNPVELKKTYLYDLKTKAGQVYTIVGK